MSILHGEASPLWGRWRTPLLRLTASESHFKLTAGEKSPQAQLSLRIVPRVSTGTRSWLR
jgi:hypothetical protein